MPERVFVLNVFLWLFMPLQTPLNLEQRFRFSGVHNGLPCKNRFHYHLIQGVCTSVVNTVLTLIQ